MTNSCASATNCWDYKYSAGIRSAWTANRTVASEIYRRMTGTNSFWINWAFEHYLPQKSMSMLSIGCGDGAHELIIARENYARHIDAFDASPTGIALAKQKAAESGFEINFRVDTFEHFSAAPVDRQYDLILFAGSLHHVYDLEAMLDKTRRSLVSDGYVLFNEYIGPCHLIFEERQVRAINRLLARLAPEFKISPNAQWVNPSIDQALASDPSEAVRSAILLPLLESYFNIEWKRFFGGALLHPMFDLLNREKLADGSPESTSLLGVLLEAENLLAEAGAIGHDFCWGFCRQKNKGADVSH